MSGEGAPAGAGICDNCARDDADLVVVHRLYITPESWDTPGSATEVAETELWCFSCRSMYPHRVEEPEELEELEGNEPPN